MIKERGWKVIQSNLDYPDLDYPGFFSGPICVKFYNDAISRALQNTAPFLGGKSSFRSGT